MYKKIQVTSGCRSLRPDCCVRIYTFYALAFRPWSLAMRDLSPT